MAKFFTFALAAVFGVTCGGMSLAKAADPSAPIMVASGKGDGHHGSSDHGHKKTENSHGKTGDTHGKNKDHGKKKH